MKLDYSFMRGPDHSNESDKGCLKEAERLLESIREGVECLPDEGEEFGQSVLEKAESIMEWAEKENFITPKQLEALENMDNGIQKWLDSQARFLDR